MCVKNAMKFFSKKLGPTNFLGFLKKYILSLVQKSRHFKDVTKITPLKLAIKFTPSISFLKM